VLESDREGDDETDIENWAEKSEKKSDQD